MRAKEPVTLHVHLAHTPSEAGLETLRGLLDENIHLTLGDEIPAPAEYELLVAGRPQR